MAEAVDKDEGVPRLHLQLQRPFDQFAETLSAHANPLEIWMLEVGLVASRDQGGPSIAGPNVCEGDEGVDLPTEETVPMKAVLAPVSRRESAGVHPNGLPRFPQTDKVLIDEKRTVVVVEGTLAANKELHVFEPGGMVDQLLKRFSRLVDLLEVQS
jgi:hypothetical protein